MSAVQYKYTHLQYSCSAAQTNRSINLHCDNYDSIIIARLNLILINFALQTFLVALSTFTAQHCVPTYMQGLNLMLAGQSLHSQHGCLEGPAEIYIRQEHVLLLDKNAPDVAC